MSDSTTQALQRLEEGQSRIEAMLAQLLGALQDEGDEPERTLEGDEVGGERDQSQSLDTGEPK